MKSFDYASLFFGFLNLDENLRIGKLLDYLGCLFCGFAALQCGVGYAAPKGSIFIAATPPLVWISSR
jgi:hypothetical protein